MVIVCAIVINGFGCEEEVVLIQKKRPAWQMGKLNLPGGKIEEGEMPWQAAVRELREETTIDISHERLVYVGRITNTIDLQPESLGRPVHCFACRIQREELPGNNGETPKEDEEVFTFHITGALNNNLLIPNLTYIIPRCLAKLSGWEENMIEGLTP